MKNYLRNNKVVIRDCTKYSTKIENPTRFSTTYYAGFQDGSPESLEVQGVGFKGRGIGTYETFLRPSPFL